MNDRLVIPVSVSPVSSAQKTSSGTPVEISALWDTGAVVTCITPAVRDRLKLLPFDADDAVMLAGIGGEVPAGFSFVNICLPHNIEIKSCPVYVLDLPGDEDMIIGMDIITMGDFAVCNADGKTSFSFVMPPFPDTINLADKAHTENIKNMG
jgi:predicted aspartyl protease